MKTNLICFSGTDIYECVQSGPSKKSGSSEFKCVSKEDCWALEDLCPLLRVILE